MAIINFGIYSGIIEKRSQDETVYDGESKRVAKITPGGTTYYVNDFFEINNGTVIKYIFAGEIRIAKRADNATYYYHKDHLGSTNIVSDEFAENFPEIAIHTPFGEMWRYALDDGASPERYKFTDQELDNETGLYDYGAWLYDPALGRFISPDTIIPNPANPQSFNQ